MTTSFVWQVCALESAGVGRSARAAAQADRWQMQYFYDQAKTELVLQDMQFSVGRRAASPSADPGWQGGSEAGGGGDRRTAARIGTS